MVVDTCNYSTWEAEEEGLLGLQEQPELHTELSLPLDNKAVSSICILDKVV